MMNDFNWIAIIAATLAAFLLGWLWYGPLFSKIWVREQGLDPANAGNKAGMGKLIGLNLLLTFITSIVLAHVLATYGNPAVCTAAMVGGGIGLGFVATAFGTAYLYSRKSLTLFLIDASYWVVAYAAMGAVQALLR